MSCSASAASDRGCESANVAFALALFPSGTVLSEHLDRGVALSPLGIFHTAWPSWLVAKRVDQLRDRLGRWAKGDGGGASASEEVDRQRRVALARKYHKPATAEKQRQAVANERRVAKMIGARSLDDNEPMDLLKPGHGVEVKTLLDQTHSKVTMHRESRLRKLAWARKNKAQLHTVVLDDRDAFQGGKHKALYNGHKLYYRSGVGSFRLSTLTPVRDAKHLSRLMEGA